MNEVTELKELLHEYLGLRQKLLFRQIDNNKDSPKTLASLKGKLKENQKIKKKLHNLAEMANDCYSMQWRLKNEV